MATATLFVGAMPQVKPSIGRWIGAVVPLDYSRPRKLTLDWVKHELSVIGMSIRREPDGDYRVNFRGFPEDSAYYSPDLDDAYNTAVAMFRRSEGLEECEHATTANGVCLECRTSVED